MRPYKRRHLLKLRRQRNNTTFNSRLSVLKTGVDSLRLRRPNPSDLLTPCDVRYKYSAPPIAFHDIDPAKRGSFASNRTASRLSKTRRASTACRACSSLNALKTGPLTTSTTKIILMWLHSAISISYVKYRPRRGRRRVQNGCVRPHGPRGNTSILPRSRRMTTSLVLTFIGHDKPGLVNTLSETISAAGGSWLESRLAHLAGEFAGSSLSACQSQTPPASPRPCAASKKPA